MRIADYDPLIIPPKEPPPRVTETVDFLSWALPVIAAILSVLGGVEALYQADRCAALFAISGGIVSALGILATNWASRIRDVRLSQARNLGALGVDMADYAMKRTPYDP